MQLKKNKDTGDMQLVENVVTMFMGPSLFRSYMVYFNRVKINLKFPQNVSCRHPQ